MRIIFVNPAFNRYGGIKGHGGAMIPFNLCYLAAYARQQHPEIEVKILDCEIKGISHEESVDEIRLFEPDLICITTNTSVFDSVIVLTRLLKNKLPKSYIIIGGPHASALPERSLIESNSDFVAIGEGELILSELLFQFKTKENKWNKINGLAYYDEKRNIQINPPCKLISNLDMLPFPARDLLENKFYTPPPTKRVGLGPNTLLASSRGCPYSCGFCASQTVWTKKIRFRKSEFIIAEIEECIEKYGVHNFNFTDEFFTAKKDRVFEICKGICDRNLNISWVCSARAQQLDEETFKVMKNAGCHEISFGIESGNPEMLRRIDKCLDLNEAKQVIKTAKKVGIKTHASYLIGYIGETERSIIDTIRFSKKLNTHVAAFFIASPLPGTKLYKDALEKGYIVPESKWINYSPLSNNQPVLTLPDLSSSQLKKWHRKALTSYYLRPRYVMLCLSSIRHWYDIANLFEGLKLFFRIKK